MASGTPLLCRAARKARPSSPTLAAARVGRYYASLLAFMGAMLGDACGYEEAARALSSILTAERLKRRVPLGLTQPKTVERMKACQGSR